MRYPKTTEEVVSIVKEAIDRGVKVKSFGSRHSQTDSGFFDEFWIFDFLFF